MSLRTTATTAEQQANPGDDQADVSMIKIRLEIGSNFPRWTDTTVRDNLVGDGSSSYPGNTGWKNSFSSLVEKNLRVFN